MPYMQTEISSINLPYTNQKTITIMKKIILSAIAVCAFGFVSAQEPTMKIGASIGMPMGDVKDFTSLVVGADFAYLWPMSDDLHVGATVGYLTFMAKEFDTPIGKIKPDDTAFLPIAATGQYSINENFFLGADLGYALAMSPSGADSGMYYQPKAGYQTEKFEVYLGYKGVAVSGRSANSLSLGFNYKF